MNKTSFLDYYKTILEKVSFDQKLLTKEYGKAVRTLKSTETKDLDYWMRENGLSGKLKTLRISQSNGVSHSNEKSVGVNFK